MAESLYFCYLDETGSDLGTPVVGSDSPPIFVVAGIVIPAGGVAQMTREFVAAKREYDPERFEDIPASERAREEVKGHKMFRVLAKGGGKQQAAAVAFLHETLDIVARLDGGLVGRFQVKVAGERFNTNAVYASSVAEIAGNFQKFLEARRARGMIWCDSRRYRDWDVAKVCPDCGKRVIFCERKDEPLNIPISRAVFAKKFGGEKDALPDVAEAPAFVNSENHAGIQIADLLCSALIGPIAAAHYRPESSRADPRALELRDRDGFGERMNKMQLRVQDDSGVVRGALTSGDHRSSAPLFQRV